MEHQIKKVFVKGKSKSTRKGTEPYDLKLKAKIIKEYLQGDASFAMLSVKYKINPGVISRWVRVIKNGRPVLKPRKITKFTGMAKQKILEELVQENNALKRQLQDEQIRSGLYKKMIEIAERDLGIAIEKKYGARRSTNTGSNPQVEQG